MDLAINVRKLQKADLAPAVELIGKTVFLVVCIDLVRALNLSVEDIGLKVIRERLPWHVGICLTIFAF